MKRCIRRTLDVLALLAVVATGAAVRVAMVAHVYAVRILHKRSEP